MKKLFLLVAIIALPFFTLVAKDVTLVVNYSFKHIVKGYDHKTVTKIYVDGDLMATSTEKVETKPNTVSCTLTKGNHDIRIVNYALYNGDFEEHTVENNYSIDAIYEFSKNFKKSKTKVTLVFDIDKGTEAKVK